MLDSNMTQMSIFFLSFTTAWGIRYNVLSEFSLLETDEDLCFRLALRSLLAHVLQFLTVRTIVNTMLVDKNPSQCFVDWLLFSVSGRCGWSNKLKVYHFVNCGNRFCIAALLCSCLTTTFAYLFWLLTKIPRLFSYGLVKKRLMLEQSWR